MKQKLDILLKSKPATIIAASLIILAGGMATTSASAGTPVVLQAVPSAWRLQQYVVNSYRSTPVVAVFFTGVTAPCAGPSQGLALTGNTPDAKRFYDTVIAAKLAKTKIIIVYDNATCEIDSFGLPED